MRAWSAVLCALFGLAQIASFAHDVSSPHAVCAEHGEVIHVERAAITAAPVLAAHRGHAPMLRNAAPGTHVDHEHCGLATLSRQRALGFHDFTSVAVAPTCSPAPQSVPAAADRSTIPLFLLAPKQSPPV